VTIDNGAAAQLAPGDVGASVRDEEAATRTSGILSMGRIAIRAAMACSTQQTRQLDSALTHIGARHAGKEPKGGSENNCAAH
jgi:hypothetical protein